MTQAGGRWLPTPGPGACLILLIASFLLTLALRQPVIQPVERANPAVVPLSQSAAASEASPPPVVAQQIPAEDTDPLLLAGKALDDEDPAVRLEAAHELGELGDGVSLQVLEQLLYDSQPKVRAAAMDALSMRISPPMQDILLRALNHEDSRIRSLAGELLEELDSRQLTRR